MIAVTLLIVVGISTHYCYGHPYNRDRTIDSNIRVQPASIEEYEREEWRAEKEEDEGREGVTRPDNNGGYGKTWGPWIGGDRYNMAETNDEPIAHAAVPPKVRDPVDAIGWFPIAGCTGTFVAQRAILTAAHCVYQKSKGDYNRMGAFQMMKGCYNEGTRKYEVKSVHVTDTYKDKELTSDDYAIIITIQASTTWLPYDGSATATHDPLTIYGYPGSDPGKCLYESTCSISKNYPNHLNYQCQCNSGMSGGPIINKGEIVGVHSSGDDKSGINPVVYDTGVRLNNDAMTNIDYWITKNGGD